MKRFDTKTNYEKTLKRVKDAMAKGESPFNVVANVGDENPAEVARISEYIFSEKKDGGEIVQKAPHYQNIPLKDRNGNVVELEAWEIITSLLAYMNLNPRASWAMGDALKYILRCGRKFGDEKAKTKNEKAIQDLRKVAYYINKVADWYEDEEEAKDEKADDTTAFINSALGISK
jgi:hypothetical protein